MIVYVKCGSCVEVVSDIHLRDGHQPIVGGTLPLRTDTGELIPIEPALWYKTLIINIVRVDCDSHEVKWNRVLSLDKLSGVHSVDNVCSVTKAGKRVSTNMKTDKVFSHSLPNLLKAQFPPITHFDGQIFNNSGVYDFDPSFDTFFLETSKLMERHKSNKCMKEEFNLTILRLLHIYILPQVILKRSDLPSLQRAKKTMESYLKIAETVIDNRSRNLELLMKSLKALRQTFVSEFQKEELVRLYNSDFLRKLSYSLQGDVEIAGTNLENVQDEVNKIKILLSDDSECAVLIEKREERNHELKKLEEIATVRENVRNVINRPQKPKRFRRSRVKPSRLENQSKYLRVYDLLQEQQAELLELYNRKVKIVSVIEAIRTAINDLHTEHETVGLDFKADGSERATDVLDTGGRAEEWMTLEERVGNAINLRHTEIHELHEHFCKLFCEKVQAVLSELEIFNISVENDKAFQDMKKNFGSALDLAGQKARRRRSARGSSRIIEGLSMCGEDSLLPLKIKCQHFQAEIHEHFKKIVKCLQEKSKFCGTEGKLWICYETHIYPTIMTSLYKIYEETYRPITTMLCQILPSLKPIDLNITDGWLLKLFDSDLESHATSSTLPHCYCMPPPRSPEETFVKRRLSESSEDELAPDDPQETPKRISYELSLHSLHFLYERANADGRQVQAELEVCGVNPWKGYSLDDIDEGLKGEVTTLTQDQDLSDEVNGLEVEPESANDPESQASSQTEHATTSSYDNDTPADQTVLADDLNENPDKSISMPEKYVDEARDILVAEVAESCMGVSSVDTWDDLDSPSDVKNDQTSNHSVQLPCVCQGCSSSPPKYSFKIAFEPALIYIRSISEKVTILSKLKQLTKAFRFISNKISELRSVPFNGSNGVSENDIYRPCCDDMISVCILLLTHLTQEEIVIFYTNLHLMLGFMAPCLRNGVHDCTLVNFQGAFQYVIDNQVMKLCNRQNKSVEV